MAPPFYTICKEIREVTNSDIIHRDSNTRYSDIDIILSQKK